MTVIPEREEEEAVASGSPIPDPMHAEARRRARSITSALPSVLKVSPASQPAGHAPSPSPEAVRAWLLARIERAKARELNLVHGPPASVQRMHARHREAAAHWQAPVARNIRLGWGWLHLAVATLLYAALDAAFSPAGAIISVLFVFACLRWL